jgi:hypothetical protein
MKAHLTQLLAGQACAQRGPAPETGAGTDGRNALPHGMDAGPAECLAGRADATATQQSVSNLAPDGLRCALQRSDNMPTSQPAPWAMEGAQRSVLGMLNRTAPSTSDEGLAGVSQTSLGVDGELSAAPQIRSSALDTGAQACAMRIGYTACCAPPARCWLCSLLCS